ncbi:uncharacterized protein GIQ15_04486 [Arthroderma uncinatum]|uniref:uncharacterized protein n=1 Tax=Arthroderma uncinatum TaxID=74035 RepID=UPI00144ABC42|nr:uncharacterized protein GIQ15_04486 [Arthroderma uncinatum]KAF3481727.1 hypothetical protein GIQ15_04486 [Arthroderma uncinatum]
MGGFDENESPESHLAKAFQDVARGEQTAGAIENHLTRLEQEIDRLLGSVEAAKEGSDTALKKDEGKEEESAEKGDKSVAENGSKDEQGKEDKQ